MLAPYKKYVDIANDKPIYDCVHRLQKYYYITLSIVAETLASKNKALDPTKSMLG